MASKSCFETPGGLRSNKAYLDFTLLSARGEWTA